jgi:hypothetical protein
MGPDEFRLHVACLDLAGQSNVPGIRDRWLTMAEGWVVLADDADRSPEAPRKFASSNLMQIKPH